MTKSHNGSQNEGNARVKSEVIKHCLDHQGVVEYLSGTVRNEVQDQISRECAKFDKKLE